MTDETTRLNRRQILKSTATGGIALGLAGCQSDTDGGGNGNDGGGNSDSGLPDEVTYGWVHSLSGAFSVFGREASRGQEIALQEINNSDQILPDTTLSVEQGDSQTDPEVGLRVARELVEQGGVSFLSGTTSSSVAAAIAQYASQQNVPFFIGHSARRSLTTGEDCRFTNLRANPHTGLTAAAASQFTIDNFGDSVYVLTLDYSYGQAVANAARANLEANGVEVVGSAATPLGNEDFASIIDQIQSVDPDVVFQGINGGSAVPLLIQAGNRGLTTPMVCQFMSSKALGQLTPGQFDKLGDIYRGSVKYTREIENERNQGFVSAYEEAYEGEKPDFLSAGTYVNTYWIARALDEAQTVETESFINAANSMSIDGVTGTIEMRECDHQGMGNIQSAKVTGIDEENSIATNEIVATHDSSDYITPCSERTCSF
jgi:branched-chain amino acid transport system substrate-binding protein